MRFRQYIFDLYGTLVSVRTDERRLSLWREMAAMYEAYGADYTPSGLRAAFERLDRQERARLGAETGTRYPEIRLERVFARLLCSAPRAHAVATAVSPAASVGAVLDSGWADYAANLFRTLSRDRLRLYPGTAESLSALRRAGRGLYMLSNAQAVFTRPEIDLLGLGTWFDDVLLSSDHGRMKPDPVFMETLLAKHALERADTVMVGNDFESDARVSLACGVSCVILNTDGLPGKELRSRAARVLSDFPGAAPDALTLVRRGPFLPRLLEAMGETEDKKR